METENNPYQAPPDEPQLVGASEIPRALKIGRVYKYSYFTSLAVALSVFAIWLLVLVSATPPEYRRTRPPDILEVMFVFLSTLPSVFTCLFFSVCYCFIVRIHEDRKMWPAVSFGALSGLIFNAITTISVIEYFFRW